MFKKLQIKVARNWFVIWGNNSDVLMHVILDIFHKIYTFQHSKTAFSPLSDENLRDKNYLNTCFSMKMCHIKRFGSNWFLQHGRIGIQLFDDVIKTEPNWPYGSNNQVKENLVVRTDLKSIFRRKSISNENLESFSEYFEEGYLKL